MVSDYILIRRSKLRLTHLYMPNPDSIYYFSYGINFRAVVAWVFGVWPLMREYVPLDWLNDSHLTIVISYSGLHQCSVLLSYRDIRRLDTLLRPCLAAGIPP